MPVVIDRRSFLKTALAAGFGVRLFADVPAPAHWALLSDTHCPADPKHEARGFYPYDSLKKVAKDVADSKARVCAITGDIARLHGLPGDYDAARPLLQPIVDKMPVGIAMGNHDHRQNFQKVFPSLPGTVQAVARKRVVTMEWTDLRAVFLDSLLETNVTLGQLATPQRQWLSSYIAADPRPAFLFLHHDLADRDTALVDSPKLLQLVTPLKQVKAIFFGHTHVYRLEVHEGIHLVNIPSTAYTFRPEDPTGWMLMSLTPKGAQLHLYATGGNKALDGTKASLSWR